MKRIFFLVFFLFIFQTAQAEEQKLSQAYELQLIERVKSVFSSEAAVEEVKRPICATPIFLEVKANWDRLSAKTRKILKSYVERPSYNFTEYVYDTPQGHFKIHYVREGDSAVYNPDADYNANGHPDWVDTVGMVLEHVWDAEISVLGYDQPPSDGWYPDNGGDGRYDVYLLDLAGGYLGYTQEERFLPSPSPSATSYIVLDNDYVRAGHTQLEWLQVTAAHEFFHAIQMGYDGDEYEYENENFRPYWMEMSAVWMEDMVYDDVNDYLGYLSHFFNYPWLSLKTYRSLSDQHAYGSCVWPMYLSERFDTTIIRDIWEGCAEVPGPNAIDTIRFQGDESATDKALQKRGATFDEAFREFTVWNYFTGDRARTQLFYSEGDMFPKVKAETYETYPVDVTSPPHFIENLGSSYVVFVPIPHTEGGVRIEFDGHSGEYSHVVSVLGYQPDPLPPLDTTIFLNPFSMAGTLNFPNWKFYNNGVVMIPAVIKRNPNIGWSWEYHAFYDSTLQGESPPWPQKDEILQNYPNPFVIRTDDALTHFPFVLSAASRVRIDIFTLSGERVKTLIPPGDPEYPPWWYIQKIYTVPWNGKNEKEEYVSSGIYLYRFRTDRATVIKKMAVIR